MPVRARKKTDRMKSEWRRALCVFCYNERAASRAPLAQLDRASGYEPEGREFESLRARHRIRDLGALKRECPSSLSANCSCLLNTSRMPRHSTQFFTLQCSLLLAVGAGSLEGFELFAFIVEP